MYDRLLAIKTYILSFIISLLSFFDSQVVRLDVIAPRVVGLDVWGREWSG